MIYDIAAGLLTLSMLCFLAGGIDALCEHRKRGKL
ncbi:hypothetical protein ES702_04780 [subsurface metagenome]